MLKNKKRAIFASLILLVSALIFGIWKTINFNDSKKNLSSKEVSYDVFSDKIILFEEEKALKINLVNNEMEDAVETEKGNFDGFKGLPSLGFKDDEYLEISNVLNSKDKKQAIVQITSYEKKEKETIDPDSVKNISAFACQISEKKCIASDILSLQYEGLDPLLLKNIPFVWTNWDPKNNMILGNFVTGVDGPVFYVCNISEKKCNGVGAKEEGSNFEVPNGAISPTMEKFALIKRNNDPQIKAEMYLYSTSDVSQPLEKINVSSLINEERDGFEKISSIAWGKNGKRMAIGMDGGIFVLDVQNKSLALVYAAPIDDENDYFWNSGELYLSPDENFIAFVDSDSWIEEEDEEPINNLKKINIDTQEVSTVYSAKGLMMKL